ncbi:K1586-like protein [Mya arenaria]|uniref:K1586-like protein n=1 Tax=Mya arenaria TaxID=6604 RepID=A0ABY7EBR9_MYAAR|nr:K1586-like protein [Mya arenaria]
MDNMTGFASDGAAVFTGTKTGVSTRLKECLLSLVTVYCKDHRLALACCDSFTEVPLFKTDKLLEDLYCYYKYSSVRTVSLREVQKSFHEARLNIKEAKHHRWLSHSYLVVDLEAHTIAADPQPKNPVNLHILLLLADVLPHLASLSMHMQGNDVNLASAPVDVEKTIATLQKGKKTDGTWLAKAEALMKDLSIDTPTDDMIIFDTARVQFLDVVVNNIGRQFADTEVIEALAVLSSLREIPAFYAMSGMEVVAAKYDMNLDELLDQWHGFTELMATTESTSRTLTDIVRLFYNQQQRRTGLIASFPLVARLSAIAATVPISTAEVKRVFSQLKLIKTDHRCSLEAATLDMLLNVKLNCSTEMFERFLPQVVCKFFNKKDRRLVKTYISAYMEKNNNKNKLVMCDLCVLVLT